jgi:hypothetical protein
MSPARTRSTSWEDSAGSIVGGDGFFSGSTEMLAAGTRGGGRGSILEVRFNFL